MSLNLGGRSNQTLKGYEAFFTTIFAGFKKVQQDRDLELITSIILASVQKFLQSRFKPQFRDRLRESTSLKSVEAIAGEVRQGAAQARLGGARPPLTRS